MCCFELLMLAIKELLITVCSMKIGVINASSLDNRIAQAALKYADPCEMQEHGSGMRINGSLFTGSGLGLAFIAGSLTAVLGSEHTNTIHIARKVWFAGVALAAYGTATYKQGKNIENIGRALNQAELEGRVVTFSNDAYIQSTSRVVF
jgi:hypothetical protein